MEYGWAGYVRDRFTASIGNGSSTDHSRPVTSNLSSPPHISQRDSDNLADTSAGIFVGGLDESRQKAEQDVTAAH